MLVLWVLSMALQAHFTVMATTGEKEFYSLYLGAQKSGSRVILCFRICSSLL